MLLGFYQPLMELIEQGLTVDLPLLLFFYRWLVFIQGLYPIQLLDVVQGNSWGYPVDWVCRCQ